MKKGIIFAAIAGFVAGAAAGVGGAYLYFTKREDEYLDEINDLIEQVENLEHHAKAAVEEMVETVKDKFSQNEDPRELDNNEGVKKYHHQVKESLESAASVFAKKGDNKVTEGEKAIMEEPDRIDDPNVTELTEDEYSDQVGDQKGVEEFLTYLYPQDELYYGYGTDNQELAEKHFKLGREKIIGQTWRWATDYTAGETGVGYIYLYNAYIKKYINVEVIVDLELEED